MEDKDYKIEKERTMNTYNEKREFVEDRKAEENRHTDNPISSKNTESHRYKQN